MEEMRTVKEIQEWAKENQNVIRNLAFVYGWNQEMIEDEASPLTGKAKEWYRQNKDKPWFIERHGVVFFRKDIQKALFPGFQSRFPGIMDTVMDKAMAYFRQCMHAGFSDEMRRACAYDCARYLAFLPARTIELGGLLGVSTKPYSEGEDQGLVMEALEIAEPFLGTLANEDVRNLLYGRLCDACIQLDMLEKAHQHCLQAMAHARSKHNENALADFYARCIRVLSLEGKDQEAYRVVDEALAEISKGANNRCFLYMTAGLVAIGHDSQKLEEYGRALIKESRDNLYYRFYGLLFMAFLGKDKMEEEAVQAAEKLGLHETYEIAIDFLFKKYLKDKDYEKGYALADRWVEKVKKADDEYATLNQTLRTHKIEFMLREGKDCAQEIDGLLQEMEGKGDVLMQRYFLLSQLVDEYNADDESSYLLRALAKHGSVFNKDDESVAGIYHAAATIFQARNKIDKMKECCQKALERLAKDPEKHRDEIQELQDMMDQKTHP